MNLFPPNIHASFFWRKIYVEDHKRKAYLRGASISELGNSFTVWTSVSLLRIFASIFFPSNTKLYKDNIINTILDPVSVCLMEQNIFVLVYIGVYN